MAIIRPGRQLKNMCDAFYCTKIAEFVAIQVYGCFTKNVKKYFIIKGAKKCKTRFFLHVLWLQMLGHLYFDTD